jgi:hypothetical protein
MTTTRTAGADFRERMVLVVSVPVLLALTLGWFRAGSMARDLALPHAVLFWLSMWLGYWAAAGGFTWLTDRCLPPLRRQPALLFAFGGLLACAASAFYMQTYASLFDAWLPAEQRMRIAEFASLPLTTRIAGSTVNSLLGAVLWVAANLVALRLSGKPQDQEAAITMAVPVSAETDSAVGPDIAPRAGRGEAATAPVPVDARQDARALEHYIMVYLRDGRRLLHFRFRDAVAELECVPGAQVHRSWWISRSAACIAGRDRKSGAFTLRLPSPGRADYDLTVPVGRTWREAARALRLPD